MNKITALECDECKAKISIKEIRTRTHKIKDDPNKTEIKYLSCPKCGQRYLIGIYDKEVYSLFKKGKKYKGKLAQEILKQIYQEEIKKVLERKSKQEEQKVEDTKTENQEVKENSWKCECGIKNEGNFCCNCGTPRPLLCKKCNTKIEKGAKFCSNCGEKVDE